MLMIMSLLGGQNTPDPKLPFYSPSRLAKAVVEPCIQSVCCSRFCCCFVPTHLSLFK